jgi:hypothetical protein
MDTITRENSGVGLGDQVEVKKVESHVPVYEASKIVVAPLGKLRDGQQENEKSDAFQKDELLSLFLSSNLGIPSFLSFLTLLPSGIPSSSFPSYHATCPLVFIPSFPLAPPSLRSSASVNIQWVDSSSLGTHLLFLCMGNPKNLKLFQLNLRTCFQKWRLPILL